MFTRSIRILAFLLFSLSALSESFGQAITSTFYLKNSPSVSTTIVFVHGLTSNSLTSWMDEESGAYWPDIVADDKLMDQFNVAVINYPSSLFRGNDIFAITADVLNSFNANISPSNEIIFVAHSMGGIIVREMIMADPTIAARTKGIITFATPMGGSRLADVARFFAIEGPAVRQLTINEGSNYTASLFQRWISLQNQYNIPVYCSSEGKRTGTVFGVRGALVVEQASAWLTCHSGVKLWPELDHNTINKPTSFAHPLHSWLRNTIAGL